MSTIEIFFSYSHKDETLREELKNQLSLLKWQGLINDWHDRRIGAGQEWANEIDKHLNTAQIILLLISPDFMASKYCYGIEVKRAIERHERGEARVIPVILRPVYWQGAPFGKLQALPTDTIPVTSSKWHNLDEAFFNVAEGIRKAVEEKLAEKSPESTVPPETLPQLHEKMPTSSPNKMADSGEAEQEFDEHASLVEDYKIYQSIHQAKQLNETENEDEFEDMLPPFQSQSPHIIQTTPTARISSHQIRTSKEEGISKIANSGKVDVLKEVYEAVRTERITDPTTIREIAAYFESIANNPEESQNVDFDAARAARTLLERAALIEEQTRAEDDYGDETQPDWSISGKVNTLIKAITSHFGNRGWRERKN